MNREFIEIIIFGGIFCFQVHFFIRTLRMIRTYNRVMPDPGQLAVVPVEFDSEAELTDFVEDRLQTEVLSDNGEVQEIETPAGDTEPVIVNLLQVSGRQQPVTITIVETLNKYLARNRHSAADFNLMQDVVERNTDVLEEEINLTLSTPLYLGLMGTMAGIIWGIFSMSGFYQGQLNENGLIQAIAVLLTSVRFAMITSFLGLLMTIINSAVIFKSAKYQLEQKKNTFYNYLQVHLLPLLNQGIGATFTALQRNLARFNEQFDANLDRLSGVFDKNYTSVLLYKEILDQLDKTKVAEMTKYNVQVLNELQHSMEHFHRFNELFANLDYYVSNTYALADKSTALLERTDDFAKIAGRIEENLTLNVQLSEFLTTHFAHLDAHRQKVGQAVDVVSFGVKDTFEELMRTMRMYSQQVTEEAAARNVDTRNVFEGFSEEIRSALTQQTDAFAGSMQEQTTLFRTTMDDKQSKLDYLAILEPLLEEIKAQRPAAVNNGDRQLSEQLSELTSVMAASLRYLKRIEKNSKMPFFKKIFPAKRHEEE